MNIKTSVANINFDTCIFNASGCWCTTKEELDELSACQSIGAIVSKSSTLEVRNGNPKPRLCLDDPNGSINSMGIPNYGFKFYMEYGNNNHNNNKPFIQSIVPFSIDELKTMLLHINENTTSIYRMIELNLSCPNLIKKAMVGYDFELFEEYISMANNLEIPNLIIGLKLPPYYHDHEFDKVSTILLKYPIIKFVTCINSVVNGLLIDIDKEETTIHPKEGFGGIGGAYCKPVALANVNQFYKRIGHKIDIIGCGGISNGDDVFAHLLAGASAVQVGTLLVKEGPQVFNKLVQQLYKRMDKHNYTNLDDFKGKLKIKKSTN